VIVSETPPLFTAAAGVLYAAAKRAAHVVNVADRWPASAVELGALSNPRAIAAAEWLERWIYRRSDLIVAPTAGIVAALEDAPDAHDKVRRVWPVVDYSRFDVCALPAEPGRHASVDTGGPLRLLFAGTVGLAHGLDVLVCASQLAGPEIVQTTIAGDGADAARLRAIVHDERIANVRLLGAVPADTVPDLYRRADASAVLLRDLPIFAGALPTKLLEAMSAGRPLLLAAHGESARFVTEAGAGIVVAPGDASALAEAIRTLHASHDLRRQLGRSGRAYVERHFGADRAAAQWSERLIEAVAARRARG
jgi:glycosyltransferase involved in cell wall biosynthesis